MLEKDEREGKSTPKLKVIVEAVTKVMKGLADTREAFAKVRRHVVYCKLTASLYK